MAFISMVFVFLGLLLLVVGTATFIGLVLYIVAFVISRKAKKKTASEGIEYKRPVKVLVLRVFGTVFMVPLICVVLFVIYVVIMSTVESVKSYDNLSKAVEDYDYRRVEKILEKGVDPDCTQNNDEHVGLGEKTLLIRVVEDSIGSDRHSEKDRIRMAELLLDYGADVNAVFYHAEHEKDCKEHFDAGEYTIYQVSDHCGYTPLLYAVSRGDLEMVKVLEAHGADIQAKDYCGFNAIATAADSLSDYPDGVEMLEYLVEQGVSLTEITNYQQSSSWLAYRQIHGDGTRDNQKMMDYLDLQYEKFGGTAW